MKFQTTFIEKQKEVTENQYYEMLEVLPPERMTSNAFLVGEASDHYQGRPRFALYFTENGKFYYGGLATIKDFKTFCYQEPEERDRPEYSKQYALTGRSGTPSVMNGNGWKESEVTK